MSDILHIADNHFNVHSDIQERFKIDVQNGLQNNPKSISSKYLYDDYGAALFNQISRHPDYYLTRCEIEILDTYKKIISNIVGNKAFNLVELGPGEGVKTRILIDQFLKDSLEFIYEPIDISIRYLSQLLNHLKTHLPNLQSRGLHSDYFDGLSWISQHSERKNLVLFLGSNIGNYDAGTTLKFLKTLGSSLNHQDYVLIGFDLCKDINILMHAYNDSDGLTRDFNLNLLRRLNRELGANFNLEKFQHYPIYNPEIHSMESYLISVEHQLIHFDSLKRSFIFDAYDSIHLEYSRKFQLSQLSEIALSTGFRLVENFLDEKNYFVDSLWCVDKTLEIT